jgi:hypothetical protein
MGRGVVVVSFVTVLKGGVAGGCIKIAIKKYTVLAVRIPPSGEV